LSESRIILSDYLWAVNNELIYSANQYSGWTMRNRTGRAIMINRRFVQKVQQGPRRRVMKVLIAVDDSPISSTIIDEVARRSWATGTEFMVLTVVPFPTADYWQEYGLPASPEALERMERDADKLVASSAAALKEKISNIAVEEQVKEGFPCEGILETANQWDADLIIMGSHGRHGLEKLILGSVAEAVLSKAPCSVEVVKTKHTSADETTGKKAHAKKQMVVLY
jgi:nucleotide-binding universal stress UspA family protein